MHQAPKNRLANGTPLHVESFSLVKGFHPAVRRWFESKFREPTPPQAQGWPLIQEGRHALIASPTGSGKTLAAFLCAIDHLVRRGAEGALPDATLVLYISPLKALANDVRANLLEPLGEISAAAGEAGLTLPEIRPLVRSGDTPPRDRRSMMRRPPHILVTTPESLFILLTSRSGRRMLADVRHAIVDEIHALARDKRGAHLQLSLERLESLIREKDPQATMQRIGLSATQKPIDEIAEFLCGEGRSASIVDVGHSRPMELTIEVPQDELSAVATQAVWDDICGRLVGLIRSHAATLIFVNTRRLAERLTHQLEQKLEPDQVATHHGSLARELRLQVEERLKGGRLRAVVATASLELGIDIGTVELVCQIGSTRSIALARQRIGRSGHWVGATPKGTFFPTTRDDLVECAALVRSLRDGDLDRIRIPQAPLDVLAQQITAAAASREWKEDELFRVFRRASSYRRLAREDFDAVLTVLAEGISTRAGRRRAYLHRDRINGRIRGRRGARLAAITSGGAIPDIADYLVKSDPEDLAVGTVDEDFAVESSAGDIFLLGNASWRIRRIESGVVRVEDARGAPPTIPFWRGEAPARTDELSAAVDGMRREIDRRTPQEAIDWLRHRCGLDRRGAEQAVQYVHAGSAALGGLPGQDRVVAERFFDEGGGMQLVLHAPFGARMNRAWGLALRKRFCRSFNFELQAAATENGVLISLAEQHSFPLDAVFSFLSPKSVREVLVQALVTAPLFRTRWRWNATRSLAVLRFAGGRKVPSPLQRMRADDLLASVFPEAAACQENIEGDIEIPDHPLVEETLRDCLTEAMDLEGLQHLLERIERGEIRCIAVDTREPSPFSHEILNANPYAFLDDAPLEERRARAVAVRRGISEDEAEQFGRLDAAAIEEVVQEASDSFRNPDEVHDALLTAILIPEGELKDSSDMLEDLASAGRAFSLIVANTSSDSARLPMHRKFWLAAERLRIVESLFPDGELEPPVSQELRRRLAALPAGDRNPNREDAIRELVRGRLDSKGPIAQNSLVELFGLEESAIEKSLLALEGEGSILRGRFTPGQQELEWCERTLLARIHRRTLGKLRREIEPVSTADLMRFLFHWQHLAEGAQLHGVAGVTQVLGQLQGFEAPAASWEPYLLSSRVSGYESAMLDRLCLSGQFVWGRFSRPAAFHEADASGPERVRPTRLAPIAFFQREEMPSVSGTGAQGFALLPLSHPAREVLEQLERWGACFVSDLTRTTGRLPAEVEEGLWELVAAGLVAADGFDNLRSLIDPKRRLLTRHRALQRKRRGAPSPMTRWALLRLPGGSGRDADGGAEEIAPAAIDRAARQLLRRWGVVFRDLIAREMLAPPWRELLRAYRRMEARGEIRGGRFVAGFAGEQFALPEAVDAMRAIRRKPREGKIISISAADPLNLIGIILPGERVRPHPETLIRFEEGILVRA